MHITKDDFPVDLTQQSLKVPSSPRNSNLCRNEKAVSYIFDDVKTVAESPLRGQKVSGDGPCLGWRDSKPEYKWLTYGAVIRRYRRISSGLVEIGMKPGQDTFVGIYAKNCIEWVLIEHACYVQSTVLVPLYDTLGPTTCAFILNQVASEIAVCDTEERAKLLLEADVPSLRHIVIIRPEDIKEDVMKMAEKKNVTMHQLKHIEELGKTNPVDFKMPDSEDLATVCYTSGTTGNPKGVMITHANMVAEASASLLNLGNGFINSNEVYLSFMPLAHMLERGSLNLLLMSGARIGFSRGEVALISEDIQTLRPTGLITVPRVLNKVFDKIQTQVHSSKIKKFLLDAAVRAKQRQLNEGVIRNDSVWDILILKNIRNALGGRLRIVVTAGAPIRDDVLTFFRCCLGCPVLQAYGQTEATSAASCTVIGDCTTGVVGPPLPCCLIKLIDVPDLEYYASRGEGEILIRGPIVAKGYFKDPVRTQEVFDQDGWLHTGDVGQWTENGSLRVVDRVKHLLKLSQGEYISPEKIESIYEASPLVEQCFVDGDSLQSCLVAIVVPNPLTLKARCKEKGIQEEFTHLCQNEEVKKMICLHLYHLGKEAGLKGFEQVKAVHLRPEPFSLENGLLTVTLKLRRAECRRHFKEVIKEMYGTVQEPKLS